MVNEPLWPTVMKIIERNPDGFIGAGVLLACVAAYYLLKL
uniref:Uncharacterized protein n=1 Tax=Vibrio splendidus TaxID=29497 RepID=A0A0H3ZR64_VIBSP|nr:hypothetical protein [Vibrio splendidus]